MHFKKSHRDFRGGPMAKRLCVPTAGGPSQIPGQGTRAHVPQMKTQWSQINIDIFLLLFCCCCWQSNVSALFFFFPLYNIVLILPYIDMSPPRVYTWSPSWIPSPSHPSGSSQCTSCEHPASCIETGLAIHFTYDNLHVSMPFSHIIPPSPSPTESKRLQYICVSFAVSHTGLLLPPF